MNLHDYYSNNLDLKYGDPIKMCLGYDGPIFNIPVSECYRLGIMGHNIYGFYHEAVVIRRCTYKVIQGEV